MLAEVLLVEWLALADAEQLARDRCRRGSEDGEAEADHRDGWRADRARSASAGGSGSGRSTAPMNRFQPRRGRSRPGRRAGARLGPVPAVSATTVAKPRPSPDVTPAPRPPLGRRTQVAGGGDLSEELAVGAGQVLLGLAREQPRPRDGSAPRRPGWSPRRHSEGVGYIGPPQEDWPPRRSLAPRAQPRRPSPKSGGTGDAQIEPCFVPRCAQDSNPSVRGPQDRASVAARGGRRRCNR